MAIGRKIEFEDTKPKVESPAVVGRKIDFTQPQVSRLLSLLNALPKGLIKGAQQTSLLPNFGPVPAKLGMRLTEQFLPTQERVPEQVLERTGKILPSALIGGNLASGAIRSLVGGALGEATEKAGGGELAQTIAEASAFGLPGLGRKIIPTKGQEKLVDYARRAGLEEKHIAPLLPGPTKRGFFGKIAAKGGKTQNALQESKQSIGRAYDFVSRSPEAAQPLSQQASIKFLNDSSAIASKIPATIRKQLVDDARDLVNHGLTGENLINWYQDIGDKYKIGREHLERLKQPIIEAMESVSPQMAEDFKLTNELFKRRLRASKTLKPGLTSELMDLGELGKLAYSIMNFSMKGMSELLGLGGVRRFAREMLINPRLQNISQQMIKAANQNKMPIVLNLAEYIKKRYEED